MDPNPLPPTLPQNRTAPGAIWSLVLGILSLTCFSLLAGIPAVICGHMTRGKIRRSGDTLKGAGMALAGIITGYISIALAVFVLPIALAVTLPAVAVAKARAQQTRCISNLRQIDEAIEQWALAEKKGDNSPVTWEDLRRTLKPPVCPAGGTYTLTTVSEMATCSIPGHAVPAGQE